MDAQSGGSNERKAPSATANEAGKQGSHVAWEQRGGETKFSGIERRQDPWEWGETMGGARPPEWTLTPTELGWGRGAARPPEWRKTPGGVHHRVGGGVELSQDDLTRYREGGGVELYLDHSTSNGRGRGFELWQEDSNTNQMGGGVKSSQVDSTPREAEGHRGDETLGSLTASQYQ